MKFTNLTFARRLIIAGLLFFSVSISAQYYPTKDEWQRKAPTDFGLNADKIKEAVDFAMANEYSGSHDLRIAILTDFALSLT